MEKLDLKPTKEGSLLQNANGHHQREGFFIELLGHQIQRYSFKFPVASRTASQAVATASWLHGLSGAVYPTKEVKDAPTPMTVKGPLVLCGGRSKQSRPTFKRLQGKHQVVAWRWSPDGSSSLSTTAMWLRRPIFTSWMHLGNGWKRTRISTSMLRRWEQFWRLSLSSMTELWAKTLFWCQITLLWFHTSTNKGPYPDLCVTWDRRDLLLSGNKRNQSLSAVFSRESECSRKSAKMSCISFQWGGHL